jgi:hypothetical protein
VTGGGGSEGERVKERASGVPRRLRYNCRRHGHHDGSSLLFIFKVPAGQETRYRSWPIAVLFADQESKSPKFLLQVILEQDVRQDEGHRFYRSLRVSFWLE